MRPCRYCLAAWGNDQELCEFSHRDLPWVATLAEAMARLFQSKTPSDEQIGWFMDDADSVVDDFNPLPVTWKLRSLPDGDSNEFNARFRINEVTYVYENAEGVVAPVRLSTFRQWQREAESA